VDKKEFVFDQQQERITLELKQEAANTLLVEKLEMLKELAFNADNLAEVAEDLELEAKVSEPFSENGGAGVASLPMVVAAATAQKWLKTAMPVRYLIWAMTTILCCV